MSYAAFVHSPKNGVKTVQRHIWKDYEELADDARYTPEYKELYAKRKETIERVFADAKEKHAMRYTFYRGLTQVSNWVRLKFAAMNLKKLARWKTRRLSHTFSLPLSSNFSFYIFLRPVCFFQNRPLFDKLKRAGKSPPASLFYSGNTKERSMSQSSSTFTFSLSLAVPKSFAL